MEMIPVSSSNIGAIGYDDNQSLLVIEFLNGTKGKVPWNENSLVVKDNTIVTIE